MNTFGLNLEIYFIYNFQLFITVIIIIMLRIYTGTSPALWRLQKNAGGGLTPNIAQPTKGRRILVFFFVNSYKSQCVK